MIRRDRSANPSRTGKPRASGDDPGVQMDYTLQHPVNPARAGMIPSTPMILRAWRGKPRASGDDPAPAAQACDAGA